MFFYSYWNILYLPLILFSIFFNFSIGNILNKEQFTLKIRKFILTNAIFINLIFLAYYKYSDFLIQNYNFIFKASIPTLNLLLPLAISFFTFQQIAYLVDSYRGETKNCSFLDYSLFITFFPQLIAGPIVYYKDIINQLKNPKNSIKNYHNIILGLLIFSIGLFKKVVIADNFAIFANSGFNFNGDLSFFEAWGSSLSYTMQLYFDFSGYSDMAIGGGFYLI